MYTTCILNYVVDNDNVSGIYRFLHLYSIPHLVMTRYYCEIVFCHGGDGMTVKWVIYNLQVYE